MQSLIFFFWSSWDVAGSHETVKTNKGGDVQCSGVALDSRRDAAGTLTKFLCQCRALQDYLTELKEFGSKLLNSQKLNTSWVLVWMLHWSSQRYRSTHTWKTEVAWNAVAIRKKEFQDCLLKLNGCFGTEKSWELCKVLIIIFISHQSRWNNQREETKA